MVGAVHPICKGKKGLEDGCQWRLSFSRAEVTLLNSWTPVQQIVYHMLRFVMKQKVFSKTDVDKNPNLPSKTDDEDQDLPKMCNYHIKTLMLWECEQRPQSWWSAESSIVKLCSSLLDKLSVSVAEKQCQNYFIASCNLFDHFVEKGCQTMSNMIRDLVDERDLLRWFVDNYIRKCALYCPANVSTLFEDNLCCSDQLEKAVDVVIEWKLNTQLRELYNEYKEQEQMILGFFLVFRQNGASTRVYAKQLETFDRSLSGRHYFTGVWCLRVAWTISMQSLTEDLLEVLWTIFHPAICGTSIGVQKFGGCLFLGKAIKLATLSCARSNVLEMLHYEMSKAYLHYSLKYAKTSVHCLIDIMLAVLYYKSGHYRTAIAYSKQVLNQHGCGHSSFRCIGADFLPSVDESVDSVFGLILFYRHVHQNTMKTETQLQHEHRLVFSTELLAHYLLVRCTHCAQAKSNKVFEHRLKKYRRHLSLAEPLLLSDVVLFKTIESPHLDDCTKIPAAAAGTSDADNNIPSSMDDSLLVTLVELAALEHFIPVRQLIVSELHSERFPLLNEFEVLHAYRCGLFQECLDTCRHHVDMLLRVGCPGNQRLNVAAPVFHSLLDDELVSFFGIIRLTHPVWYVFMLQFPEYETISFLTLSLHLIVQCQRNLHLDSLHDSLQLIRYVHDGVFPADDKDCFIDRLILKLSCRSLKLSTKEPTSDI